MGPQALSGSLRSTSLRNEDLPALFALIGSTAPASLAIAGAAPLELTVQVARDTGAMTASGQLKAARVQFGTLDNHGRRRAVPGDRERGDRRRP